MFARPVAELATLRGKEHVFDGFTIHGGEQVLAGPAGDLLEITVEAEVAEPGFHLERAGNAGGLRLFQESL